MPAEPLKHPRPGKPPFALNQSVPILPEKDRIEVIDHFGVVDSLSAVLNQTLRQQPIVVPTACVLKVLNQIMRDQVTREVADRFSNGFPVRLADLDQNAVHVEDDYVRSLLGIYQSCSNSSRNF